MSKEDFEMPKTLNQSMFKNAKLYYDREDFLLDWRAIDSYLEIGVLAGDYTDLVIKHLKPNSIDLVDPFNQYDWNRKENPRFDTDTNYDFIKNKYKDTNINIIKEYFVKDLNQINKIYDYIYIDAEHSFKFTYDALEFANIHLSVGGLVGINDYIMYDHFNNEYYGVVQGVNAFLINNPNWKVYAYALGAAMHSDIYLKKIN